MMSCSTSSESTGCTALPTQGEARRVNQPGAMGILDKVSTRPSTLRPHERARTHAEGVSFTRGDDYDSDRGEDG